MTATKWKIGQHVWLAGGTLHGREWDIEAEWRETEAEAQDDATGWLSWLSKDEREHAQTYVREYRILDLENDGSIGTAVTI